ERLPFFESVDGEVAGKQGLLQTIPSAVGSVWTEVSFCRVVSNLWPDGLFSTIRSGQSVLGCLRTIDAFAFRGVGT
ncbi:hypothetical protein QOT94_29800, partial [Pseudomonas aeruginosa]